MSNAVAGTINQSRKLPQGLEESIRLEENSFTLNWNWQDRESSRCRKRLGHSLFESKPRQKISKVFFATL